MHNIGKVVRLIAELESNDFAFFSVKVSIMCRCYGNLRFTVIAALLVIAGVCRGQENEFAGVPDVVRAVIERETKGFEIEDIGLFHNL